MTSLDLLQGQQGAALKAWRMVLALNRANITIRKQIWRVEYPEQFYPEIDVAWQQEQLAREGYNPGA